MSRFRKWLMNLVWDIGYNFEAGASYFRLENRHD